MPRVKIENLSLLHVKAVIIELPNNKLVFGPLKPSSIQTIYHSLNQKDGTYKYYVKFESGEEVSGECGYITANEFGKSYLLTLRPDKYVTCNS
jgi:hypothetical protein